MRIEVRSESQVLSGEMIGEIQRRCRLALGRIDTQVKEVRVAVGPNDVVLVVLRIASGPEIRVDASDPDMLDAADRALDRVSRAAHRWIELRKDVERRRAHA
jgi:ribosome-associated translation inhibitor RaiA